MLATLGAIVAEVSTGVSWVDAGKVELAQASYLGLPLPFNVAVLTLLEVLLVGGAEVRRAVHQRLCLKEEGLDSVGLWSRFIIINGPLEGVYQR